MKVLLLYIFSKNISIESDYLETKMRNFDIRIEQNIRKILTVFFVIICTIKEKNSNHSSKQKSPVARRNLLFKQFNTID